MEKWGVRIVLLATALACLLSLSAFCDESPAPSPRLLLSAKLLRRLKRDRDRQTVRWNAFANRVKNVPDSPERGFELALDYAVTGDEAHGKEAIVWAAAHPCERRQRALIRDWVAPIAAAPCATTPSLRDQAFEAIAAGNSAGGLAETVQSQFVPQFAAAGITSSADLYAAMELLSALRAATGSDNRSAASQFFRNLPVEFLLSLRPEQVESPDWMTHVAALALISVDPNLESSQFLQGWAMEDRHMLKDGPGIAYELLWADPYLPGIAYQNLDPWMYDEAGSRLFARSDWSANACWISISKTGPQTVNCPAGYQDQSTHFGTLTLVPMQTKCLEIPHQQSRENMMIWKLAPGQAVVYKDKKDMTSHADQSGLWHPGNNIEGKVCRR